MSYNPQAYGPPVPQHYQSKPANGFGKASMVVGIVALATSWIPLVNNASIVAGIVAIALAVPAALKVRKGRATNKGQTIAGVATGLAAVVLGLVVQFALASALDSFTKALDSSAPTPTPAKTAKATPSPTPSGDLYGDDDFNDEDAPSVEYDHPKKADFSVELKTKSKDCFGSAGCVITYGATIRYSGYNGLDPSKSYDVTYTLTGGSDGATVGTVTVSGDPDDASKISESGDLEGVAQTSSRSAKLTAKITDFEEE